MRPAVVPAVALVAVLGVAALGCGRSETPPAADGGVGARTGAAVSALPPATSRAAGSGTLRMPKAQLQATLDQAFAEHVRLVLATTGAITAGREADAGTARSQLDANSEAITGAVVGVYGPDAAPFGDGWRKHVQAFADYATATKAGDEAARADARTRLDKYPKQVGAFLASANPNLTEAAVADLVRTHIVDMLGIIDLQGRGDTAGADARAPGAADHITHLSGALAGAIAAQFPDRFAG